MKALLLMKFFLKPCQGSEERLVLLSNDLDLWKCLLNGFAILDKANYPKL
jgi:hypothetical protein